MRCGYAVIFGPLAAAAVLTQASPPPDPDHVADLIVAELKAANIPGAGIAVVSGDRFVARGYGVANAQSGASLKADTAVHLGSLTKLFTALAVTNALDGAMLPPDTAVGDYVQGLSPPAAAATFHRLLTQTSGLRDRAGDTGASSEAEIANAARELNASDFILPPGTVFWYSNLGYALAGAALEGLRNHPYADVMRTELFAPLGMTRSTLRVSVATAADHARGHRQEKDALQVVSIANDTRIWPAGYMWASADDIARALSALMHDGRLDGKQVLPASVVARVMAARTPMPNVFVGGQYGYGLMIYRDRGVMMYEHGGTLPGFSSIMRFTTERRLGIAILSNLDNGPLRRIAQVVMAKALQLPDQSPPPRKETPATFNEMKDLLGNYHNRGTADLDVRGGKVVLILDDGPPMEVSRLGSNRYLARPAPGVQGPEFVVQPATGSSPGYLHFALWAYAKR